MPLLALVPVAYAQNNETSFINNETLNQAPDALKSAYNEAKNTSMGLVNQATNLIKNDTNSSRLLSQLDEDVGTLITELSNFFSR